MRPQNLCRKKRKSAWKTNHMTKLQYKQDENRKTRWKIKCSKVHGFFAGLRVSMGVEEWMFILYWAQNRMNYDCSGKHAEKSHDRGNSKQLLETHDMAKITHEHGKNYCMARQKFMYGSANMQCGLGITNRMMQNIKRMLWQT